MYSGQVTFEMVFSFERSLTYFAYETGTLASNTVNFSQMSNNIVFLQSFSTNSTFDHVRWCEAPIICKGDLFQEDLRDFLDKIGI